MAKKSRAIRKGPRAGVNSINNSKKAQKKIKKSAGLDRIWQDWMNVSDAEAEAITNVFDEYGLDFDNVGGLIQLASDKVDGKMASTKKSKAVRKTWGGAVGDRLVELFERKLPNGTPLVPREGDASTDLGQLVRGMNAIMYRYYNDGDIAGVGYGKETLDWVFDYMHQSADASIQSALDKFYEKYSSYDVDFEDLDKYTLQDYINEALGTDFDYYDSEPEEPEEPDRDDYDSDEDYEDAMFEYEEEMEEYEKRAELWEDFDYYMSEPRAFAGDYGGDYERSAIRDAESAGYEADLIALAEKIVSYVDVKWIQMFSLEDANEADMDSYSDDSWDYYDASARKSKNNMAKREWEKSNYDPISTQEQIESALKEQFGSKVKIVKAEYVGTDWEMGSQYWVIIFDDGEGSLFDKSLCYTVTTCIDWTYDNPDRGITFNYGEYNLTRQEAEKVFYEKVQRESNGTRKSLKSRKNGMSFESNVNKMRMSNYQRIGNINRRM